MDEKINLIIRKDRSPEVYDYFLERKQGKRNYIDILTQLVKENQRLSKEVVKQNDWTGMRLALRATEKNSHLAIEMLNNIFLSRPIAPIASHIQKSPNLLYFEQDWKAYIEGLQAERSTHKKTAGSKLPMPSFDFGEDNE